MQKEKENKTQNPLLHSASASAQALRFSLEIKSILLFIQLSA